jgi:hypothetical protein
MNVENESTESTVSCRKEKTINFEFLLTITSVFVFYSMLLLLYVL